MPVEKAADLGIVRTRQPWLAALVWNGCLLGILLFVAGCAFNKVEPGLKTASTPPLSAETYQERGNVFFEKGAFPESISNLAEALRLYGKSGNIEKQCEVLIKLSRAYEGIGEYHKALDELHRALALTKKSTEKGRMASVLGEIGNVYIVLGPEKMAYQYLNEGLQMALAVGDSSVSAAIQNNLGNLFSSQKKFDRAAKAYEESASRAETAGNHLMACVALTNEATALVQQKQYHDAKDILDKALGEASYLKPSHFKAYTLVNMALAYQKVGAHSGETKAQTLQIAAKTLQDAAGVSKVIGDDRGASYALGYLGKLREDENRSADALILTEKAIFAGQRAAAPESIYLWEWQKGRLLAAAGKIDEAISAYRTASAWLKSIRQEMSNCYGRPHRSFREPAGPLYRDFVDLLLQRAALCKNPKEEEPYLLEARETLESLKVTELRDYFHDDCVDAAREVKTRLDFVSKSAVVIYPILLKNRTELLVSLPSGMKRYAVPVGAKAMTQEIRRFRRHLEKLVSREYLIEARQLYDWLIRPIQKDLESTSVTTLVFVPDGPLRTIPMAALNDGREFLIQKYAIAVTPGLDLTDPRPIDRKDLDVLALGLSDPVQGFSPLPFVPGELQTIQNLYKTKELVNKKFTLPDVEKSLRDQHFTIVHIASHGQFRKDADKSFLLTFDGKLTMKTLDQDVGLLRFRKKPLDLLTLSACDTAAGDDRAALGLAGIAIRAGARSALGTLWHINDQSSSILVEEFYRQLRNPSISRAVALQRAQLKLLKDPRFQHPRYWSPFLLINDWL